jgi:hypothetical protein
MGEDDGLLVIARPCEFHRAKLRIWYLRTALADVLQLGDEDAR